MKRLLRWAGLAVGALVALTLVAYAVVHVVSEGQIQRRHPVPGTAAIAVWTDPESIEEGKRLATVLGCLIGCHGKQGEGAVLVDDPILARLSAPNLTASVRALSDAELDLAVRHGLRPDGRSLILMPSEGFIGLSDGDLGRIIAYFRSIPVLEGPGPDRYVGPVLRLALATGEFRTAARLIAESSPLPAAASEAGARGRYLAKVACSHCHGSDLRGMSNPSFTSPDLGVVAAYSPEQFTKLLRTGIAIGDRQLGEMGAVARDNLSHLNDAEINALYSYLLSFSSSELK